MGCCHGAAQGAYGRPRRGCRDHQRRVMPRWQLTDAERNIRDSQGSSQARTLLQLPAGAPSTCSGNHLRPRHRQHRRRPPSLARAVPMAMRLVMNADQCEALVPRCRRRSLPQRSALAACASAVSAHRGARRRLGRPRLQRHRAALAPPALTTKALGCLRSPPTRRSSTRLVWCSPPSPMQILSRLTGADRGSEGPP